MQFLVLIALALICVAAMSNERVGVTLALLVGLAQDPVRKIIPGEPVYMTALVGVVVVATFAGLVLRGEHLGANELFDRMPTMRIPVTLYVGWVLLQAGHAFVTSGSLVLPIIGLIAYLAPLVTLLVGYHFVRSSDDLCRALWVYVVAASLMCVSVAASYWGVNSRWFEAVGEGLNAFAVQGGILELHNGLFRGSELAGWHGATAGIFALIVALFWNRIPGPRWLYLGLAMFCLACVFFTGRRKFIVEGGVFVILLTWFVVRLKMPAARMLPNLIGLLLLGVMVVAGVKLYSADGDWDRYFVRLVKVKDEAPDRIKNVGFHNLKWVYKRNGFFGKGAGVASSGAQHFGGGSKLVGSAAEGGLGKIMAELGVPGLLFGIGLVFAFVRHAWSRFRQIGRMGRAEVGLAAALLCFILSNALIFLISHMIYGDVFVLILLGLSAGAMLRLIDLPTENGAAKPGDGQQTSQRISNEAYWANVRI